MAISALDGYGLEDLKKQLYEDFFQGYETDNAIICNVRQITCLRTLALDLSNLLNFLNDGIMDDVVAYHLHHAIEQLGEISGELLAKRF
jgi:tRNA U34 5-carboxymethylaminomethyl modifying GTPase MnmE/TrmE